MNEEIKEILDDMKQIPADESWALNLEDYQCKALLNYITNIQEELKKEKRINNDLIPWFKNREKELKKQINVLQKESKHLKETNEEHCRINGQLRKENDKLNGVIDKIEEWLNFKIEDYIKNDITDFTIYKHILNKLTELKGGDDKDVEN